MTDDEKRKRYAAQCTSLHLKPWQEPPCVQGDEPIRGTDVELRSMELRRRMIDAGIDPWHPHPLAALEEAA